MPQQRRKGEPVAIRLDLHVDDALNRLAAEAGKTRSQYCFDIITANINARLDHPSRREPTAAVMLADYRRD